MSDPHAPAFAPGATAGRPFAPGATAGRPTFAAGSTAGRPSQSHNAPSHHPSHPPSHPRTLAPSHPDVSVIIVSWNGIDHLEACLSAVAAQRGVSFETVLVDNGSSDGTADFVRARFPWVRLVELPENRGFAGGNNAGVRESRGQYVALLNNDTIADADWLRSLRDGVDEQAGFSLVTSRVVFMHDPDVIDSAGDGMLRWGGAFKRHHGGPASLAPISDECFGVSGAACLMPRRVFDELNGFDEDFFVSHEDVDLSYRARLLGYRCRYVAGAVVRHHGSATLGRVSAFSVYHGQRNLEWVFVKNTPTPLLLRTLAGHLVYDVAAALHFARAGLFLTFVRAKIAAVAGLPKMIAKRKQIQARRRITAGALWPLLESRWLATKLREKRFDLGIAGDAPGSPHHDA
jgi:GT2 family glycosyltransferase